MKSHQRLVLAGLCLLVGGSPGTAWTEAPPQFLGAWGSQGSGSGQFDPPRGVAVDVQGKVYVADRLNGRIQVFSDNGTYLTEHSTQIVAAMDVAVDLRGNIFAMDTHGIKVVKLSSSGGLITMWGVGGTGDGQFNGPKGICVDADGNVYVADTSNHRIQKFNNNGSFITKWGEFGTGNGQFYAPMGIAADGQGHIYVADTANNRVQKFTSGGSYLMQWNGSGGGGQFYRPSAVDVDTQGNVYVADTDMSRVQKYTGTGTFLTKWGNFGYGDGEFYGPRGVAVGPTGEIFVADTENYRIQKFGAGSTTAINSPSTPSAVPRLSSTPNPFRRSTSIEFTIAVPGPVTLNVFDLKGRLVRTLLDVPEQAAGGYTVVWDGHDSGGRQQVPGVYFLRLQGQGFRIGQKILLVP